VRTCAGFRRRLKIEIARESAALRMTKLTTFALTVLLAAIASAQEVRRAFPVVPNYTVELEMGLPPVAAHSWAPPKPGDDLFDFEMEARIEFQSTRDAKLVVRVFRRGLFVGYAFARRIHGDERRIEI
jgi:hypothetical protein